MEEREKVRKARKQSTLKEVESVYQESLEEELKEVA